MKQLGLLLSLFLCLIACRSTAPPVVPADGEAFAGIGLQFET